MLKIEAIKKCHSEDATRKQEESLGKFYTKSNFVFSMIY